MKYFKKYLERRLREKIMLALLSNPNHNPDIRVEFPTPYSSELPEGTTARLMNDAIYCIKSDKGYPFFVLPSHKKKLDKQINSLRNKITNYKS